MEILGRIFNIQRFTIHDGPGVRTEIFFKGCPLRCLWCSNPEGISPKTQLGIYPSKCIGADKCGLCTAACPLELTPLTFGGGAVTSANRALCPDNCSACSDACPSSALIQWGRDMSADELLKIILADRSVYQSSGGGATLSGGEVLLQWEFARELLRRLKENYIHTCVESALHCNREHMEAVFEFTDLVITDIKLMDTRLHKRYTGAGNGQILGNIRRLAEMGKRFVIRLPIIPGYNDSDEHITAAGQFILGGLRNSAVQVQLLPYRRLGVEKHESLNQSYPMGGYTPLERAVWEERLLYLTGILTAMGIPAAAGSNVKY